MTLTVSNLVAALDQFPAYHEIDVFADDLAELHQPMLPAMHPLDAQGRSFVVPYQGRNFRLDIFPERGVARFSRSGPAPAAESGAVAGMLAGGPVGAAIAAASEQKGAGLLGGTLLGLLVGATLGGVAGAARRVFALAYDSAAGQWRAYDGGLLRWMKDQLAVHVG